jgi:hypothetical protein
MIFEHDCDCEARRHIGHSIHCNIDPTTGERQCKRQEVTHLGFATKCEQCGKGRDDDEGDDLSEYENTEWIRDGWKEKGDYSD